MDLSIIISTYNNAKSLERTLNSVAKQDADKSVWECIVVNNNSTDDTALRVSEFAKNHSEINIRLVDESQ
ncbi:MAG: glycosyltransferase family 2 protein, partial [Alistipes sp.]|nr:glycosyltransferase family 2 protein [Alistipes sp.]